jgi:hypothetical protein
LSTSKTETSTKNGVSNPKKQSKISRLYKTSNNSNRNSERKIFESSNVKGRKYPKNWTREEWADLLKKFHSFVIQYADKTKRNSNV